MFTRTQRDVHNCYHDWCTSERAHSRYHESVCPSPTAGGPGHGHMRDAAASSLQPGKSHRPPLSVEWCGNRLALHAERTGHYKYTQTVTMSYNKVCTCNTITSINEGQELRYCIFIHLSLLVSSYCTFIFLLFFMFFFPAPSPLHCYSCTRGL